ncbi:MAG: hypothetical protein QCI38_09215, partial [Candidatus Thermoplasmatota archaeon]|nr:hypothetical protein [Candidatus Thermoplasmatota archaeon]
IHGELSPVAENEAQEMAILVDKMTSLKLFDREWFSPPADELATWLHKTGFTDIGIRYFEETVRFKGEAAMYQIKTWLVKPEFYEASKDQMETRDMELPMNQVLSARKPKAHE